jgi:hypothetical protein
VITARWWRSRQPSGHCHCLREPLPRRKSLPKRSILQLHASVRSTAGCRIAPTLHAGDRALPAALLPFSRRGCRRNPQRLDSISASCPECPTSDDRERVVRWFT